MKKTPSPKFKVNRETIRALDAPKLGAVVGGAGSGGDTSNATSGILTYERVAPLK